MNRTYSVILLVSLIGFATLVGLFLTLPQIPESKEVDSMISEIPKQAWTRKIGEPFSNAGIPKSSFYLVEDEEWAGVPLGGLGSGSIGRSYRGDFSRWHLDVGVHQNHTVFANQFSVYIDQAEQHQSHVLSTLEDTDTNLDWNWDMPVGGGTYHALFPKAWYVYDWDGLPVNMMQKQFSPIIPGNYKESSYPLGIFEWTVENPTDSPLSLSIMMTWENLIGRITLEDKHLPDRFNYAYENEKMTGVILTRQSDNVSEEWDGSFAILTNNDPRYSISYDSSFSISNNGTDLWNDFSTDGELNNLNETQFSLTDEIGSALAVKVDLASRERIQIPFVLSWDFPISEFKAGTQWFKRYTQFFGISGKNAWDIAVEGLENYQDWENEIDLWQSPILDDTLRPDWYKTTLFNELYYLVDGGTFWENGLVVDGPMTNGIGRFAFMECFDYIMYNTFDVLYYASFSLVQLWPELQKNIIRDFIDAVSVNDTEVTYIWSTGEFTERKIFGAVPHDIGYTDPFFVLNEYRYRDTDRWKDLNSKFVLQLYRDYVFTKDISLINNGWNSAILALEYLKQFDTDGDTLPENEGIPDQTYDEWEMAGESAYCAGLWLAALEAALEMGELIGNTTYQSTFSNWLTTGKQAFEAKLWNGEYYNYDTSNSSHHDSIMADQLAGQWYADALGLDPIVPESHIDLVLDKVYNFNVIKFASGQMGAVNGMRPDGTIDTTSEQSQEVWTGTTFALAAFMIHRGMIDEAWDTAYGIYNVIYNTNSSYCHGYWFRTPEAWDINGNYRASLYMRPQSVWAIEHALNSIN